MNQIGAIQILRAIAAMMVVFSHGQKDAAFEAMKTATPFTLFTPLPWDTGVDLFFVISGFIMVYASERMFAAKGGAGDFMGRRLIRIVPLYWLSTALLLVVTVGAVSMGHRAFPSLTEIATSLGFIPYPRAEDGALRPVASLGWTLNYEMFFYVVFAMFIRLRRDRAVVGVSMALAALVAFGALVHPRMAALSYWSDPIVLEFVLGMWLALAWRHGLRLAGWPAAALGVVGLIVLALDLDGMNRMGFLGIDDNGFGRLLAYGVPMAAIFASVVLVVPRPGARGRVLSVLALVGDASYALYLFHPFAVIVAHKVYAALGLASHIGFWPLVACEMPIAIALAILVHLKIERPVSDWLNAWFKRYRGGAAAKPILAEPRPL